jgi:hypothetical protein
MCYFLFRKIFSCYCLVLSNYYSDFRSELKYYSLKQFFPDPSIQIVSCNILYFSTSICKWLLYYLTPLTRL